MSSEPVYRLRDVGRTFQGPTEAVEVLSHVDLEVAAGESVAILGASGSGKTTLLNILGTLDVADRGEILFLGRDLGRLTPEERARLRNAEIGFVFQFHQLLPEFTTLENVALPGMVAGLSPGKAREKARAALQMVGLEQRMEHGVTTLSGGERQRAAIARAIALEPKVLLADEPTGNLDEATGRRIGALLARLNRDLGMTMIVVTHNHELAHVMGRRLELRSGEIYAC